MSHNDKVQKAYEMVEKFSKVDYFTQKTIMNEFPEFFGLFKHRFDTDSIEHFPERRFDFNEFFGGFIIVLISIGLLGKFLPFILLWSF